MNVNRFVWIGAGLALAFVLCLVPMAPHDWGDDFAMYIMQAASYSGDSSYADLYIYNSAAPMYAPPSYPPGFSLIITPVYAVAGLNLEAFQYAVTLLLALTALLVFCYARTQKMPILFAVVTVVMLCFHHYSLVLRDQVLSDIPFTGMIFLFLYLQTRQKSWYVTGVIALCAVLTRSAGIALAAAWLAEIGWIFLFERKSNTRLLNHGKGWLLLLAGTLGAAWVFPVFSGYSFSTGEYSVFDTIHENYVVYKLLFEDYFMFLFGIEEPVFKFVSWPLTLLFLTGVYVNFRNKERTGVFFFGVYLIMLLAYPYKWGGYRMIFPLIPFLWLFMLQGTAFYTGYLKKGSVVVHATMAVALTVFIFLQPLPTTSYTLTPNSVESTESKELFTAIKKYVPEKSVVLSARPRALALFTRRPGIFMQHDSMNIISKRKFIQSNSITYLVKLNPIPHQNIDNLAADTAFSELLWNNAAFSLYRLKD